MRPRVFGIGLNKTGTTSLHRALQILGYRSLHWGGPPIRKAVERALAEGRPALTYLDPSYDAFSDIEPLAFAHATVDAQYPGSRFILTVRPMESWIDSRRRHVERNRRRAERGEYAGNFLEIDEEGWRAMWQRHLAAVTSYFGDRSDLLVVDLTRDPGWGQLCEFLETAEPVVPFPWENRGRV